MTYLLILLVLIVCLALLDARYRLFLFSQPLPAAVSLLGGTGIFLLWDVIAIEQGIFLHLDSPLMTGIMLGDQLPMEEAFFLFFLCYQSMLAVLGFLRWSGYRKLLKLEHSPSSNGPAQSQRADQGEL
ncbi:lycopene cyclase domain-containing protein [Arthrobacter psychrochitiniphilus]|uniref:Lycopene cyclase domain-containing protein n=1 Tax=Arthrobacter psychrochitiniphilus TaxID=291045 RepID=A0A2V3DNU3_9MICC|nr:lycopene cyclase domain-containing protein [Arthrobacter psychrochitiniphilus]NYG16182.1 lycopene cyclase domain-containing protein [Arthrobacter psychrochitiniphilus]PXA64437.1 lycopene cyclase domain-containing protein [Arthrobacter psychrochitiniphilus]